MNKILILNILILFTLHKVYSQNASELSSDQMKNNLLLIPSTNDITADIKNIKHKMYLTENFDESFIDGNDKKFYLRFNMFKNEMEFMKNDKVFYLNKIEGRTISFKKTNKTYKVLKKGNSLQYFEFFDIAGENKLLLKQSVKYVKPKPAETSYQKAKEADFKRESDVYYLNNKKNLTKIPTKKKKFYLLFNDKSSDIKTYCKKNKINIKEKDDLIKVIRYYNTL